MQKKKETLTKILSYGFGFGLTLGSIAISLDVSLLKSNIQSSYAMRQENPFKSSEIRLPNYSEVESDKILQMNSFQLNSFESKSAVFDDYFYVNRNNFLVGLTDEGKEQTELKIPDLVVKIGDNAFQGSQASTIIFANSVTVIGNSAFSNCTKLETVKFDTQSKLEQIGESAFSGCKSLKNITFPGSVKTIGKKAFSNCINLSMIIIPPSVTEIGDEAFHECHKLEDVIFQGRDQSFNLGNDVFQADVKLFYFNNQVLLSKLSDKLNKRKFRLNDGDFVFNASEFLVGLTETGKQKETLIVPGSVKTIAKNAFQGSQALTVVIPNSVETIDRSAFSSCEKLKTVEFTSQSNLNQIGANAFSECTNLETITIPDSVETIGDKAFANCKSLKNINIPNLVKKIGAEAFKYCENLKKVSLNEQQSGLESIGIDAFYNCKVLEEFTIPKNVVEIGRHVFYGCTELDKNPDKVLNYSPVLFDWWVDSHKYPQPDDDKKAMSKMSEIKLSQLTNSAGKEFRIIGDYAFKYRTYISITLPSNLQSIDISESIERIGDGAFLDCKNLKEVTFVENSKLEKIGADAFKNCIRLISINIPKNVKEIGINVFDNCKKLTSDGVFNNSPVLFDWWVKNHKYPQFENETMEEIVDQNGIINLEQFQNSKNERFSIIGPNSFSNRRYLTSIVIPTIVQKIGSNAFLNCYNLKSVTFFSSDVNLFKLEEKVFPSNVSAFYFKEDEFLNYLKKIPNSGIDFNKCFLVDDLFDIDYKTNTLKSLKNDANKLSNLIIPGFVKIIGDGTNAVFDHVSYERIIIPPSVDKIEANAFKDCHVSTEIVINSFNVKIDKKAFVNMLNEHYCIVNNSRVLNELKQNGVSEDKIRFFDYFAVDSNNDTKHINVGIIVVSVILSILVLGLGIGIPIIRKRR